MRDDASPKPDYRALYQREFDEFGVIALWNKARLQDPSPEHALVIARALRINGDWKARRLAEKIEAAARAVIGDQTDHG
jgi:hypothetical protein